MAPTKAQLKVATNELRAEANLWGGKASLLGNLALKSHEINMSMIEGGILFAAYVSKYQEVAQLVAERCEQGQTEMTSISDTLRHSADTYDNEEARNEHAIHNSY